MSQTFRARVKPLEWEWIAATEDDDEEHWFAFGKSTIDFFKVTGSDEAGWWASVGGFFDTADEAKQKCQKIHDARVLALLDVQAEGDGE